MCVMNSELWWETVANSSWWRAAGEREDGKRAVAVTWARGVEASDAWARGHVVGA